MKIPLLIWLSVFVNFFCLGQSIPLEKKKITAYYTTEEITIDGALNEQAWNFADTALGFWQNWPYDTAAAKSRTEVKILYNEHFVYVGAKCYQHQPENIIQTMKRDFSFRQNDAFAFHLDPFMDGNNGFVFSLSAAGVQMEGLITGGGGFARTDWDNVWFGNVQHFEGYYIAEMAIPFNSIRFKPQQTTWAVNFIRNDVARNEMSSWQPLPRNLTIENLAYTGHLNFTTLPEKAARNISLIPYVTTSYSQNQEVEDKPYFGANAGFDAKVAITPSLNLDLTVNPDFSQVEVDRQVTNLERFDLFFPERRTFFLENSDLFANLGTDAIQPFFSRRIGLLSGRQVPILYGARLSGKINKDWRIGVMNLQTEGMGQLGLRSQNYSAAVVQRQVLQRSNITGFFLNRQAFVESEALWGDYNRVGGLEFNYYSKDGRTEAKVFHHRALVPGISKENAASAGIFSFNSEAVFLGLSLENVQENYISEVGFVPRLYHYDPIRNVVKRIGYTRSGQTLNYKFYPESEKIVFWGPEYEGDIYFDNNLNIDEINSWFGFSAFLTNRSSAGVFYNRNFVVLHIPTNITGGMAEPLSAGSYVNHSTEASFSSDQRKLFSVNLYAEYGSFFTGEKFTTQSSMLYRLQPWGRFGLNAAYNKIKFQPPNSSEELILLGPEVELFLSRSLSFTTFIQYNTQIDNININSRIQWEFRPLSFLYIVYTDNYLPENFSTKSRALVLKLNYWLNV